MATNESSQIGSFTPFKDGNQDKSGKRGIRLSNKELNEAKRKSDPTFDELDSREIAIGKDFGEFHNATPEEIKIHKDRQKERKKFEKLKRKESKSRIKFEDFAEETFEARNGFMGMINTKTLFTVGEKGKREHVTRKKNNNIFDVGFKF